MTPDTGFPLVTAAVAACRDAMTANRAANLAAKGAMAGFEGASLRVAVRRSVDALAECRSAAYAAYGRELLPAILPGEPWSPRGLGEVIGDHNPRAPDCGELRRHCPGLLDHPMPFRRRGSRGPLTWRNGVQISEPYWSRGEVDDPDDHCIANAEYLWGLGLGAWHRRDLSQWYPGWTTLVIIGPDLKPEDAARFGFTALGVKVDASTRAA